MDAALVFLGIIILIVITFIVIVKAWYINKDAEREKELLSSLDGEQPPPSDPRPKSARRDWIMVE
jgi:hypothetical protein